MAQKITDAGSRITYLAADGANQVVHAKPCILRRIIIGKDVTGGIVEASDHASDGDGNVKVYLEDPNVGVHEVNAKMYTGLTLNITTQTNVAVVWEEL